MEELKILLEQLAGCKKREIELNIRIDELSDFIENTSVPLHWVNGSGIIIWANKAELDLLGYSKEDYVGKHISNFHADQNIIEDILRRLINKETLKNYQATLKSKNGKIIPVVINSNVRWEGNKFIHTRCFTRDISDLKKLEEEKIELINDLQEKNRILKEENDRLKRRLKIKDYDL